MRNFVRHTLLLLLAIAVLAACATSPTGRKQLMLVSEDSAIAQSKSAYVQTVQGLDSKGMIEHSGPDVVRVKEITGRLITEAIKMRPDTADWEWNVVVIDDPKTVNAWCMAGGRMAIYTGLLEQVDPTDDELAQVMGHEISHALANHTAEKMSMSILSAAGVTAVAIASDHKVAATSAASMAAIYAISRPNSRMAETEADRIGIELAAKAGYDPKAAKSLWAKMGKVGGEAPPEWMSTHPNPENRQQTLAGLEDEMMAYYDPSANHPEYKL